MGGAELPRRGVSADSMREISFSTMSLSSQGAGTPGGVVSRPGPSGEVAPFAGMDSSQGSSFGGGPERSGGVRRAAIAVDSEGPG